MQIELKELAIGSGKVVTVDARQLHDFLGVKKDFSTWIKDRIEQYQFIENQDFVSFPQNGGKPTGGRPAKDYALTIDMAKELAMVERNDKGRQARRYFIECERALKEASSRPTLIIRADIRSDGLCDWGSAPIFPWMKTGVRSKVAARAEAVLALMRPLIEREMMDALCGAVGVERLEDMTNSQAQMAMELCPKLGAGQVLVELPNLSQMLAEPGGAAKLVRRP